MPGYAVGARQPQLRPALIPCVCCSIGSFRLLKPEVKLGCRHDQRLFPRSDVADRAGTSG